MGELLEAGQAADEAARAPRATEEAADGEDPTLGLDLVLDIGQHLGGVGRGVAVVIKRQTVSPVCCKLYTSPPPSLLREPELVSPLPPPQDQPQT